MDDRAAFLKKVDIFSLLSNDDINKIVNLMKNKSFNAGEILFNEGDAGSEMYIVEKGVVVSSIKLPDGSNREVASFSSGNFFGEMSIFEKAPRSATCTCKEKTSLVILHETVFFDMISEFPGIATKIMYRILNITTQRLRDTSEFLADMVQWGEAARKRAITDELTGAYNRRFLDDALENQFEISQNKGSELSLIMVDLDFFREVNDEFGFEKGDILILEVVRVFNRHLRKTDILARYGGDEFTVLMPDTGPKEAYIIADKIRVEIAQLDLLKKADGSTRMVSTSQGIASFPSHAVDPAKLKELADQSLYRAKEQGRNRVVTAV